MIKSLFYYFFLISHVHSGTWTSSGGDLASSRWNPWFLKNVKDIQYCIQLDESKMSVDQVRIQKELERTFSYWNNNTKSEKKIGWKNYVLTSCSSPSLDIAFKFGKSTLTETERRFLGDRKVVAISIRKAYNDTEMRGKGIVFFSSDEITKVWSDPNTLFAVASHELGHIFGVPHVRNHFHSSIMHPDFPRRIYERFFYGITTFSPPPIQRNYNSVLLCSPASRTIQFFLGRKSSDECVKIQLEINNFAFYKTDKQGRYQQKIGRLTGIGENTRIAPNLQRMFFPDNQKVFTKREMRSKGFFPQPTTRISGIFKNQITGVDTPMSVIFSPHEFRILSYMIGDQDVFGKLTSKYVDWHKLDTSVKFEFGQ